AAVRVVHRGEVGGLAQVHDDRDGVGERRPFRAQPLVETRKRRGGLLADVGTRVRRGGGGGEDGMRHTSLESIPHFPGRFLRAARKLATAANSSGVSRSPNAGISAFSSLTSGA